MKTSDLAVEADLSGTPCGGAERHVSRRDWVFASLLLFLSGAAGLAHQILWTRRMVDFLGASTDTFSKVVGAFFIGLALGGWWSAVKPAAPRNAWRRVAGAELAVALLGGLVLFAGPVADFLRALPAAHLWVRVILPVALMTPPAIAMGLVLPAVCSAIPGNGTAVWLYAINTLGGIFGIAGVVFFGLPTWGLVGAGLATCALNLAVGTAALWRQFGRAPSRVIPRVESSCSSILSPRAADLLAFASGFLVLGLEVVGQHQFAQVTINSHFSSATVLAVVLLALTFSSLLVGALSFSTRRMLSLAFVMVVAACALEPFVFLTLRPGLQIIPYELPPGLYFTSVGILAMGTLAPVFMAAGLFFPLLLREAGNAQMVARWLALNGLGGWLGAELTPAFVLPALGLWRTVIAAGLAYGALGAGLFWLNWHRSRGTEASPQSRHQFTSFLGRGIVGALGIGGVLLLGFLAGRWPQVSPAPEERVVEVAVGREGVVATVVHQTNDWRIIFNNTYTLGGSRAQANQERQAHLPILLQGRAKSVALLGVATGSTLAGAGIHPGIERIDAFELSPLVARFAREHFAQFNRHIFDDPRVRLTLDDARWGVTQNAGRYDVVVGDLFLPWRTGEGRLFTREHFAAVRRSLTAQGLFCQWLPLFQLTRPQFELIARTFRHEFTNAFLVRGDFYTELPIVGLCGFADGRGLSELNWAEIFAACSQLRTPSAEVTDPLVRQAEGVAMCVVGYLAEPPSGPLNTLANSRLEWEAGRNIVGLSAPWFVGVPAAEYLRDVVRASTHSLPASLRAAHDSGQFFLTLEIAAKLNAPVLNNLREQMLERLPISLRLDPRADWSAWPMRLKPEIPKIHRD